jgi:hypothetical protein
MSDQNKLKLVVMLNPTNLDLAAMLHPRSKSIGSSMATRPKPLGSDGNARSKSFGSDDHAKPKLLGFDKWPSYSSKQKTNRGQLNTLIARREKRKKKLKQSIIDDNPTIIYLCVLHYVKEGTLAHLSIL